MEGPFDVPDRPKLPKFRERRGSEFQDWPRNTAAYVELWNSRHSNLLDNYQLNKEHDGGAEDIAASVAPGCDIHPVDGEAENIGKRVETGSSIHPADSGSESIGKRVESGSDIHPVDGGAERVETGCDIHPVDGGTESIVESVASDCDIHPGSSVDLPGETSLVDVDHDGKNPSGDVLTASENLSTGDVDAVETSEEVGLLHELVGCSDF